MNDGKFDTDSTALANRLELQHRRSSFDLNGWIFDLLQPGPGHRCLDLGCGRGNQSLPLAEIVGESGSVTAVDLSPESLRILEQEGRRRGTDGRIRTVEMSLDDLPSQFPQESYDRIVSSYALYYVERPEPLLGKIRDLLAGEGRFLFCGPSHENNLNLRRLVVEAGADEKLLGPTRSSSFMVDIAPSICRNLFGRVETFGFENSVRFESPEEVLTYWRSHNLYDEDLEDRFQEVVERAFAASGSLTNVKHGTGVLAAHA